MTSTAVGDVMTTRVVAVRQTVPFKVIATLLTQYRVSAFPVLDDDGQVVGVVSETDLLSKEALVATLGALPSGLEDRGEFAKAAAVTATDLMTKPPVTITPGEPVTSAARLMYQCKVKRLPVVTEDGRLVGIISRADVLSVYRRRDEDIRQEITQNVIGCEFGTEPARFAVAVKDGVVTLEGCPETACQGRDILAASWHVEGIVSVRDRLTYPQERSSHV
jgi:CBS domain-containing protein